MHHDRNRRRYGDATVTSNPLDPYGGDVLSAASRKAQVPRIPVEMGLRVVHRTSGMLGRVTGYRNGMVTLKGPVGQERVFRLQPEAFQIDGRTVTLEPPAPPPPAPSARTYNAAGSVAVGPTPAKVAAASRLLVEGVHDAALIERVWGDDLRVEGIVVERLDGADHLPDIVAGMRPGRGRRLGVLLDHLVEGSKESRIAASVRSEWVAVAGIPYVDIWQAVSPAAIGIPAWPDVPNGQDWKTGTCRALGWPHATQADIALVWRSILAKVTSWRDLDRGLVTSVERLIDFTQ